MALIVSTKPPSNASAVARRASISSCRQFRALSSKAWLSKLMDIKLMDTCSAKKRKNNVSQLMIWMAVLLLGLTACSQPANVVDEDDEPDYRRAKRALSEGRNDDALDFFLDVIESRETAPESHLEVGRLYLSHLDDPISAIYHFRQYLRYKPDSEQRTLVEQLIETSKKEFARTLPGQPFEGDYERVELLEIVDHLQRSNQALKQQVATLRNQIQDLTGSMPELNYTVPPRDTSSSSTARTTSQGTQTSGSQTTTSQSNQTTTAARTHKVTSGDTLSSISQKYYGTPNKWMDIYRANQNIMSSPNALRVGQELKIP